MVWGWAYARCRGTSHAKDDSPCQDAVRCLTVGSFGQTLVAIVSDGAGTAQYSNYGSALAVRSISESAREYFSRNSTLPSDDEIWDWIDLTRDRIGRAAELRSAELRQFAATLVAVCVTETDAMVIHIGDGAAVLLIDGDWKAVSWPAHGEFASTTFFLTDEPSPKVRISRTAAKVEAVSVFSDGQERLALEFSQQRAYTPFFSNLYAPVSASPLQGLDRKLSEALAAYLDSSAINQRTDDDKSLIVAVRK